LLHASLTMTKKEQPNETGACEIILDRVFMSVKSPRILYISPFWPRQSADSPGFRLGGSQIRSLSVLRALQQMGSVEVVTLDDESLHNNLIVEPGCTLKVAGSFEVKRRPRQNLIEKVRWALDPNSDYPNGCGVEPQEMPRLLRQIEAFDLVWFFKLRSPDMFLNTSWPRSVLDIDDVPSTCERVNLQATGGLSDRLVALSRWFSWRRREKLLEERFNVLSVCSEEDKQYLRSMGLTSSIHVIPNGFERPLEEPVRNPATPPRIGFIGLFGHFPNRDGIHWFANKCWPDIKRHVPDARLRLVGLGSDGPLKPQGPDIDGLGWMADPAEEIRTWSLMVVPVRVGGGTRVKIAFGFSQKCPIVSTTFGAHGYAATNGHEMYLADSPEEFGKACLQALRNPQSAARMTERAWQQFLEKWTWDSISPLVWKAAEDCLRKTSPQEANAYEKAVSV
jgi:glycosyltransferase involved in cell wall biosynthesis